MSDNISKYRLNQLVVTTLNNVLRLHFDAILLYNNESYPSALQLSLSAIEELAKNNWINNYIYMSKINAEPKHSWLKLLYLNHKKQWKFVDRNSKFYSAKLDDWIKSKKIEEEKQTSIYVGLKEIKEKKIIKNEISTPLGITKDNSSYVISLINTELLYYHEQINFKKIKFQEDDEIFNYNTLSKLLYWHEKNDFII
ncbi:AbiV family abortive infection protein [Aliivibrio fischeri]|uniref:AbiV family abortive infection protein n=1 Tax=Aliivibrio fischeri TaxID=668 RepID=UPI0009BEA65D|nr:AbiV family abortive infection protein [Aliivibrio fischeri]MUJ27987.1 AbiV family abortive infection protein [Aliivibrio fischeri]